MPPGGLTLNEGTDDSDPSNNDNDNDIWDNDSEEESNDINLGMEDDRDIWDTDQTTTDVNKPEIPRGFSMYEQTAEFIDNNGETQKITCPECHIVHYTLNENSEITGAICIKDDYNEDCKEEDPKPEDPKPEDENPQEEGQGALDPDYFDTGDGSDNLFFQAYLEALIELDYWSDKTPNPVNDINSSVGESPFWNKSGLAGGDNIQDIQLEFLKAQAQLAIVMANLSIFTQHYTQPKPDTGGTDDEEPDFEDEEPQNGL